jgi:hypothetical protein
MAKRYRLLRRVDPRTAAETVKNRWMSERAKNLGAWVAEYQRGVAEADTRGFANLAVWYEVLMTQRGAIAGTFKAMKEEYFRRLGLAAVPKPVAPTIPA